MNLAVRTSGEQVTMSGDRDDLTRQCLRALKYPRGHYSTSRAAQLSGVPTRTILNWRRNKVYVPDFDSAQAVWSYRDLILVRMVAWLRQHRIPPTRAGKYAHKVRERLTAGEDIRRIMTTHRTAVLDDEIFDPVLGDGFLPYDNLDELLSVFEFQAQVPDLGKQRLWGPDLITPSDHTYISPMVLGGDPCIRRSRIPIVNIHALRHERGLTTSQIVKLYPRLNPEAVNDAYDLESRLRGTKTLTG